MSNPAPSSIPPVLKYALIAFAVLLLGIGLAAILGGAGESPAPYEGFN